MVGVSTPKKQANAANQGWLLNMYQYTIVAIPLGSNPGSSTYCVAWGKFPNLQNENCNSACLIRVLGILNIIIHVNHLAQYK